MAETSGFATDLPQSAYLAHTIRRAISTAEQRSHRYVTLEHLLLALMDDPDALQLLEGARADISGLRGATLETVNHNLATLYTPGEFDLRASYKVERVLQSASDDARRMGCAEVDGAFVCVALFHETDSPAYSLLKRHNFVFHAANAWLDRNRNLRPRQAPTPQQEEPVAAVREEEPAADIDGEAEAEILLDEVAEEIAPAGGAASPSKMKRPETATPEFAGQIEPVDWPVMHGRTRRLTPGSAGASASSSPAGRAPSASALPPAGGTATNPEADFASAAAREVRQVPAAGRGAAARRVSVNTDRAGIERQAIERMAGQRTEPEMRVEPTLDEAPQHSRGLGGAVPARMQPGPMAEPDLHFPSEASAGEFDQDLGAAVPSRDHPAAGRPVDAAESRPLRPHASARERSATSIRPVPGGIPAGDREQPVLTAPMRGGPQGQSERREPAMPAEAPPAAPRAEAPVPPAARLDDMRVRPGGIAPPAPAPAPVTAAKPSAKKAAAAREKEVERSGARPRRRPSSAASVYAGKLAENIPRRMRAHTRAVVEVRISRQETETFLAGFEGGSEVFRHSVAVTQAMSVMLRAPDGGFTVETLGPETQWIFKKPGSADKEPFGRWVWSITPTETGRRRLQLVVAARSVDETGLAGDTVLPDQIVTVQVRANYVRGLGRAVRWVALMALGGLVTEGALTLARMVG